MDMYGQPSLQGEYIEEQKLLIIQFDDPLRGHLWQRFYLQQRIARKQGSPEAADLVRQQAELEKVIQGMENGSLYLEQEAALASNYMRETGSMPVVGSGPQPTSPTTGAWSNRGAPTGGIPRQDPSQGQAWTTRQGPGAPGGRRAGPGTGPMPRQRGSGPMPRPGTVPRPGTGSMPGNGYPPPRGPQGGPRGGRPGGPNPRQWRPGGGPPPGPQRGGYPGNPRSLPPGPGRGRPGPMVSTRTHPAPGGAGRLRRKLPTIALVTVIIAVLALVVTQWHPGGSGYAANVNQVKTWISAACKNPDTLPAGSNVQFACSPQGRNILWAFALMSSDANPFYMGKQKGAQQRVGLMPVPAGLGTLYASSLHLDHQYVPVLPKQYQADPRYVDQSAVDSLEVAALILNTDLGGTVAYGSVQQGLEGDKTNGPANCARYTGSQAQTTLTSGLVVCAKPMTPAGQLAAVEDLYLKWKIPGTDQASQTEAKNGAQAAASLFASPDSPDANAQAALRYIESAHQAGQLLV